MREKKIYTLEELDALRLILPESGVVFLRGDLWAGKTTLSQKILSQRGVESAITSPTYVYYNQYGDDTHFDLYRVGDYEHFVSIWWEEILDNTDGLVLVEWPEILEPYYTADIDISLKKIDDTTREMSIESESSILPLL